LAPAGGDTSAGNALKETAMETVQESEATEDAQSQSPSDSKQAGRDVSDGGKAKPPRSRKKKK
jgi:hypothetical protein